MVQEVSNNLENTKATSTEIALRFMNEHERSDKAIVLAAVKQRGVSLYYASDELKQDIEVVEAAILQDPLAWNFIAPDLKSNRSFILRMASKEATTLYFADIPLKDDQEIVEAAISLDPFSLAYAGDSSKGNRNIVTKAYKNRTSALQFAKRSLRGDKDFMLPLILENPYAFRFASLDMRSDYNFVKKLMQSAGRALEYASPELRANREIVSLAIQNFRWAFEYASESLRDDKEFVLEILNYSGQSLRYVSDRLKNDNEVITKALTNYRWALEYLTPEAQKDFLHFKSDISNTTNKVYPLPDFERKIIHPQDLANKLPDIKNNRRVAFTNGCFDILHRGHVTYLAQARKLGDALIVALNTDESVRRQGKGDDRPINNLENRLAVMASLESVDYVTYFDSDTPFDLIMQIMPDVLIKGGDWSIDKIVGSAEVLQNGGEVHSIPFLHETSTTKLVNKIRQL